jgi:hypothetical protein
MDSKTVVNLPAIRARRGIMKAKQAARVQFQPDAARNDFNLFKCGFHVQFS